MATRRTITSSGVFGVIGLGLQLVQVSLGLGNHHPLWRTVVFWGSMGCFAVALVLGFIWWRARGTAEPKQADPAPRSTTFLGTKIGKSTAKIDSTAQDFATDSEIKELGGEVGHHPPGGSED